MALLRRALSSIVPAYLLGAAALALLSIRVDAPFWAIAALAPSAAAFTLARFYTYDGYYTTPRRYADNGTVQPAWMFLLTAAAVAAGLLVWRLPTVGAPVTAVVLVALVGTNALMSSH